MGQDAWQMIGRTPGYIVAVRPLRQGAITDFDITERMIRLLLHRCGVSRHQPAARPHLRAICHHQRRAPCRARRHTPPPRASGVPHRTADGGGHRRGLSIHEPIGNMVVDVGGGTSETAVISLGGVVASEAIRCGGFHHRQRHPVLRATRVRRRHRRAHRRRDQARYWLRRSVHRSRMKAEVRAAASWPTGMRFKVVVLSPAEARGRGGPGAPDHRGGRGVQGRSAPRSWRQDIIFPRAFYLVGGGRCCGG